MVLPAAAGVGGAVEGNKRGQLNQRSRKCFRIASHADTRIGVLASEQDL
jgi:hypothetical protein